MSLHSKFGLMTDFHELLNSFIITHKAINTETNYRKNRILSYVKTLYNKYLDTYKKSYDSEKIKDEEKRGRDYERFEINDKKNKNQSGLKNKLRQKDGLK